jgi:hypothetical protein
MMRINKLQPVLALCLIFLVLGFSIKGVERRMAETSQIRFTTGNLSVDAIQHSPIGAQQDPNFLPAFPTVEQIKDLKAQGLDGYEDYIAWGMIEPEEGRFDWSHHDKMQKILSEAGLPYIAYIWCHIPPSWLRNDPRATLMTCNAHGQKCYMFSIFDPRTIKWYEHFYRALHVRFGDKITEVYACILGPYGEGNYPLPYVNWVVQLGHCHEGYWCADPYAFLSFKTAMREKYQDINSLNKAWNTNLKSFEEITFPEEISKDTIPDFSSRPVSQRRFWLDFIHWYHESLIGFAEKSIELVVGIFGREKVSAKPGGNSRWMNPLSWGTYNPGFARLAGRLHVPMQSADSGGAYWADKWTSTAYHFYSVEYRTEAAGHLEGGTFVKRVFVDASCGASRLFSYELAELLPSCKKYLHLYTGERGITDVALLAPTTLYYLNGNVMRIVERGELLRDLFDYDVLDELLISDGALSNYRILFADNCRVIERDIILKILSWTQKGGIFVYRSEHDLEDVERKKDWIINKADEKGMKLGQGCIYRVNKDFKETRKILRKLIGSDPAKIDFREDQVWTTQFKDKILLLNIGKEKTEKTFLWKGSEHRISLPPLEIMEIK